MRLLGFRQESNLTQRPELPRHPLCPRPCLHSSPVPLRSGSRCKPRDIQRGYAPTSAIPKLERGTTVPLRIRNVGYVWGIHVAGDGGGIALKSCEAFRGLSKHFSRANQLNRQDLVITLAALARPR